jgi:transcriptional regulator with AAA-type ATPase domain
VVAVVEPPSDEAVRPHPEQPRVALAGRSVPWRHATAKAAELARTREPLLLTGERGTGKTALARELLSARGDLDPLVVDAAEGPADDPDSWAKAWADNRALLLRHAERLAQSDIAALNSLLDEHPEAPLLLTYTPGTPPGPCLQRLLDTLAARSVTLPALRERPDDIRELLPELAPKPAPRRPPLTWTLDALRALERHPWPGNITELAHLVRALAEHRQAGGPGATRRTPGPRPGGPRDTTAEPDGDSPSEPPSWRRCAATAATRHAPPRRWA